MLKFNSFRPERYRRTRFVESRFLLASENTDLQLEVSDRFRETAKSVLGPNIAVEDSWKVEKYRVTTEVTNIAGTILTVDTSLLDLVTIGDEVVKNGTIIDTISSIDTGAGTVTLASTIGSIVVTDIIEIKIRNTVLINTGEAYFDGLPFVMQSGQDTLVTGSNRALGITIGVGGGAANVTAKDEPNGLGKLLTFNDGGTTPVGSYRLVISAIEEVITNLEDPFLQNANISESTAQKLRLVLRLNVVPESAQDESAIPYTNSTTDGNLVNQIVVTPTSGGEGDELSRVTISGAEQIDGRNLEITIRNTPGANKLPSGTSEQAEFTNGTFIDSLGNKYHLNLVTNSTTANAVNLRIDKSPGQEDPVILANTPYTLIKRDVYVTDDINGNPQGALYFPIATVEIQTGSGIAHDTDVSDLRQAVISKEDFQEITNTKFDLVLADGGTIDFEVTSLGGSTTDILSWDAAFSIVNPYGPAQTMAANTVALLEQSSIAYTLDLVNGGLISKGNESLTCNTQSLGDTLISLQSNPNLEEVSIGNIVRIGTDTRSVTDIDDVNKTITISSGLSVGVSAGTAVTIFKDTYIQSEVPLSEDTFVLATRNNNKIYFGVLELQSGESSNIGSSIPQALLDYIGSPDENDSTPDYDSGQVTTMTFGAPATIDDSEYFFINGGQTGNRYYVWFDKSGSAVDPAPSGAPAPVGVEVDISAAVTDEDVAEAVRAQLDALADFGATRALAVVTATDVAIGANPAPANVNLDSPFEVTYVPGSPARLTSGTSLTQAAIDLDKSFSEVDDVLEQPIYEESIYYSTGLTAFTTINLPANSRNFDKPQQIVAASGALEVNVNSRDVYEGTSFNIISENGGPNQEGQINFTYDLPDDTTVIFRLDSLGGSTSTVISTGISTTNWSDPVDASIVPDTNNTYDLGSLGLKFKDGYFAGKLTVDGVIDPTGLELKPQASDPLAAGQAGIWVDSASGNLILRKDDDSNTDMSQKIEDLESGSSIPLSAGTGLVKSGNDFLIQATDDSLTINADDISVKRDPSSAVGLTSNGITVNVDGVTIEVASAALRLKDGGIDENKLSSSVFDTSLGLTGGAGTPASVKVDGTTISFDGSGNLTVIGGGGGGGGGSTTITRLNNTGALIPANTPVYAPSAGQIAPADGTDDTKFRVIGITVAAIANGASGDIAVTGELTGVSGFTHNSLIYLAPTIGTMTDDVSSLPPDFNIVRLGVLDGTTLIIQIEQLGSTAT